MWHVNDISPSSDELSNYRNHFFHDYHFFRWSRYNAYASIVMNKYTCIRWMSAHICMFSYKKSILPSIPHTWLWFLASSKSFLLSGNRTLFAHTHTWFERGFAMRCLHTICISMWCHHHILHAHLMTGIGIGIVLLWPSSFQFLLLKRTEKPATSSDAASVCV